MNASEKKNLIPEKSFSHSKIRLNEKGWTLVELMLVTAMIGIVVPAMTLLFTKASQGFAADEMHMQLKTLNEKTMAILHVRLAANKRMFQQDAGGVGASYLALRGVNTTPLPPAIMANSAMPITQAGTTITFSPDAGSLAASFGNTLFFAAYDSPLTIMPPFKTPPQAYTAPLSIFGAGITYGFGGPATVIIDVYRFYYYYLTTSTHALVSADVKSYGLVEWRSVQFADFYQLDNIPDLTLKPAVVMWLAQSSPANFPGGPITRAWDSSQSDPTNAFYTLDTAGNINAAPATIPQANWSYLTQTSTGILSTGFRYGICGNNVNWPAAPKLVPQYALTNADFPGGFEVGLSGGGAGLQVMIRSLLVARGASPRVVWNDITVIDNAKDVW